MRSLSASWGWRFFTSGWCWSKWKCMSLRLCWDLQRRQDCYLLVSNEESRSKSQPSYAVAAPRVASREYTWIWLIYSWDTAYSVSAKWAHLFQAEIWVHEEDTHSGTIRFSKNLRLQLWEAITMRSKWNLWCAPGSIKSLGGDAGIGRVTCTVLRFWDWKRVFVARRKSHNEISLKPNSQNLIWVLLMFLNSLWDSRCATKICNLLHHHF